MFDLEAMRRDREAGTKGPWRAFIDDSGGNRWSGWPLSVESVNEEDKTVVRTGGQWPYEWDAKTSQLEAAANARRIARVPDMEAEIDRLTAENAALRAKLDAAEADAARLREALLAAADTCDRWAYESRAGGWSTHQVTPNRNLANDLRRAALATSAQEGRS